MENSFDYYHIPDCVMLDNNLSSTEKLLLAIISKHTSYRDCCVKSNREILNLLNCSKNTLAKSIKNLEKHKYITRSLVKKPSNEIDFRVIKANIKGSELWK